jgi:hypothetical protein
MARIDQRFGCHVAYVFCVSRKKRKKHFNIKKGEAVIKH